MQIPVGRYQHPGNETMMLGAVDRKGIVGANAIEERERIGVV